MDNKILLDIRPVIDSGLVTEIFNQNSPLSSENLNLENEIVNNAFEEGLLSSQDNLCAVDMGETLLDHLKYPLTVENQNTIVKVEVQPHGSNICDDEDLEKYKKLNLPEELEHMHPPHVASNALHFLSSVAMQHKNCGVPTSSIFSPEGTVDQNVRMLPVFRSLMPPVAESSSDVCGLPQTSASACNDIAEVREAVSNIIGKHQDRAIFQSSNVDKSGCKLLTLHSVPAESRGSHRNDPKPVVICQLEGGTQILCINSCGTQELKPVHLIPQYHDQHNYLQSDVDNSVTSVPEPFLPVPGEPVLNEQELENGLLQPAAGTATFHLESHLHETVKMTSEGYCDCFANGDFCNNCNCNNCYNNQLHESERFQAIKACLDRNSEAFLPKSGKGKLVEIKPHHNRGCNCKRSGCLKNYCQCFEAKFTCSSICKCIDCKNYGERADEKNQLNMLNYMEIGSNEGNSPVLTTTFKTLPKLKTERQPAVRISLEEAKATCACLLMQAEEAEKRSYSARLAEQMIMEEFGRCLSQILHG